MSWYADLEPIDYFGVDHSGQTKLLAVGWLGEANAFPTGTVELPFFLKLMELAKYPWEPCSFCGFHSCEICQFGEETMSAPGLRNLFIPFEDLIYVAPEMIVHYIDAHHYVPPGVFIEAVLQCPRMQSLEYKKHVLRSGITRLWSDSLCADHET